MDAAEIFEAATLKERLRAATVARGAARKAIEKGHKNLIPDMVFDAIHEASEATSSSVTDEMIDAGLQHYSEGGCIGLTEQERREVVRDIIEAAIAKANNS